MKDLKFKPGCYLAFVLSNVAKNELTQLVKPTFEKVFCHHVTIDFQLTEDRFNKLVKQFGDSTTVEVTGVVIGEKVECFTVEINGQKQRLDGGYYHVTYSLQPPAKPVDSNKILVAAKGEPSQVFHCILDGSFELLNRG